MRRAPILYAVTSRQKRDPYSVASESDFTAHRIERLNVASTVSGGVPYCFDFRSERVLYTIGAEMADLQTAPFLYLAQFETASEIVSVPFESYHEYESVPAREPTFILSVGRAGTTLLTNILQAGGANSISEPDLYTQIAREVAAPSRWAPTLEHRHFLLAVTSAAISARFGPKAFIKLRSDCNAIAADLCKIHADATFIFVFRDRVDWFNSRRSRFHEAPRDLAWSLKWGVSAVDHVARIGNPYSILWYDEMVNDPHVALSSLGLKLSSLQVDAVGASAGLDSQRGTSLARRNVSGPRPSGSDLYEFEHEWRRIAPTNRLEELGLSRLLNY